MILGRCSKGRVGGVGEGGLFGIKCVDTSRALF
jgi:hypothetical protein